MWKTSRTRILGVPAALVLAFSLTACGGSDSTAGGGSDSSSDSSSAPQLGEAPVIALTAAEICNRLTTDAVGQALGVDVTEATPSDLSTPQCQYAYTSASGTSSSVTIASMRPDSDVAGKVGDAAFDYVLDTNRGLATDLDEADIDAGDRGARLTGSSLHLGVVSTNGHLITVIVPVDDASTDAVATLIRTAGDALA